MITKHGNAYIIGGVILCLLGAFITIYVQRYLMGVLLRIGQGYFPVMPGIVLVVLGVIITLPAFFREGKPITFHFRPFVCIVGSLLFFSFALHPLGLILTTAGTVLIASVATAYLRWASRLLLIAVTAGTFIGVLPGIGALATVSLLLPVSYHLDAASVIVMLAGVYYGAQYLIPQRGDAHDAFAEFVRRNACRSSLSHRAERPLDPLI